MRRDGDVMSEGIRVPLHQMQAAAASLVERLGSGSVVVVGSIRRQRPMVGDIELVARLPGGDVKHADQDPLFRAINGMVSNPMREPAETLFAAPAAPLPGRPIGSAISGLKPGFRALSLMLTPREGPQIPCQIYRSTPRNHGWVMVQRTGPREFGIAFLADWKRAYGIPLGSEAHRACIDGHLVDAQGAVVEVPTEEDAFRLCRRKWIDPDLRDVHMDQQRIMDRELMR